MRALFKTIFICVIAVALAPLAIAQEKQTNSIAIHYIITPKDGQLDAFKKALESHMRWREANGETWDWHAFEVAAGAHNTDIHYRSWNHEWADIDAYEASEFAKKADEHFTKNVEPYTDHYRMLIDEDDREITAWPDDGTYYPLIHLIGYHLKPGMSGKWHNTTKEIHAALQKGGFKQHYAFSWTVAGGPDPYVTLVLPHGNWAGFMDPEPNAYQTVSAQLGEEKAKQLFADYGAAIASAETMVVRHNPTLSSKLTN